MSESAACTAVLNKIKTVLTLPDARYADIRPNDRPASIVGDRVFISIHSEGQRYGNLDNGIDEYQKIGVTISLKLAEFHVDYWGIKVNQTGEGAIEYAVGRVIGAIHNQPDVLVTANTLLETGITSPFIEMLKIKSVDPRREQPLSWWGTETTAKSSNVNRIFGYSKTLHFDGFRRIKAVGDYM